VAGRERPARPRRARTPGCCPTTYPTGTDFEKLKWTPGIYDSVSLIHYCDNPVIESVQVAPRIAAVGSSSDEGEEPLRGARHRLRRA
jgi:hypothetical protein